MQISLGDVGPMPCVCCLIFVCVFRENLERLLEDKHFKDEIVHFNISDDTGVVDASHRASLIPLLMRYRVFSCFSPLVISFYQNKQETKKEWEGIGVEGDKRRDALPQQQLFSALIVVI